MPMLLPQIAELLESVPGASPTSAEDLTTVEAFVKLEMTIGKSLPVKEDYLNCIAWATQVLKGHSKNLRAAAWLALAWFRVEKKLSGLNDGMLLLAELLERYSDKLFPAQSLARSKAIQYLSTSKVTAFFKTETYPKEEVEAALAALQHLVSVCAKHFPQNGPVLLPLQQALESQLNPAPNSVANKPQPTATNPPSANSISQPATDSPLQPAPTTQAQSASDEQTATSNQQPIPKLEIPEIVAELLKPVSTSAPTGRDVTKTDDDDYTEFLMLQSESNQIKPNYDKVIELSENVLKDKCKDLEVMAWLAFAWFGKRKIAGLHDGALLMLNALELFSGKLFPEDGPRRSRSVSFLNRKETARILAKEKVTKENAKDVLALKNTWGILKEEYHKQLGGHFKQGQVSPFKAIAEALDKLAEDAEALLKPPPVQPTTPSTSSSSATNTTSSAAAKASTSTSPLTSSGVAVTSNDSARQAMRKGVLFFFEEDKDGKKTRKVADDVAVYALSRELRWSKLTLPDYKEKEEGKITALEGPTPEKQNAIKNWISNSEWDALIPDVEIRFLNDEGFPYWLDGQRYVVQALEAKGGKWLQAAQEVKFQLARLIRRVPELPKLMFKDRKTAFAEKATTAWLENEVRGMLGAGKVDEKILPPIMGEEYDSLNQEYEAACAELPENFEKHAESMQKAIAADVRRKGRFLRGLNLANYCLAAKKPELAKALLMDLMQRIEAYQLLEWEPALCIAVWQSAYLANLKLLNGENHAAQKAELQAQQSMLFDAIGKFDCLRALDLARRQTQES